MPPSDKTYYLVCPKGVHTGGPTAIHQLATALTQAGRRVYLMPSSGTRSNEPHPTYAAFGHTWIDEIDESEAAVIITSESDLQALVNTPPNTTRAVWWLSIDNSPYFRHEFGYRRGLFTRREYYRRKLRRLALVAARKRQSRRSIRSILNDAQHFTQSHYARTVIYSVLDLQSEMLSDYTTPITTTERAYMSDEPLHGRKLRVAINPRKGMEIAEHLMNARDDIEWKMIKGLTPQGVWDLLADSDIYLDLGHHPGKDRMPREAALAGTVVALVARGAGYYEQDYAIDPTFRIPDCGTNKLTALAAHRVLDVIASDLSASRARQERFRATIAQERQAFEAEVLTLIRHCESPSLK